MVYGLAVGGAVLDMQYELYKCCSVLGDVDVAKLPSVFLFIYHRVRMGIVLLLATCIALRFYKDYKREVALLVAFLLSERNVFPPILTLFPKIKYILLTYILND